MMIIIKKLSLVIGIIFLINLIPAPRLVLAQTQYVNCGTFTLQENDDVDIFNINSGDCPGLPIVGVLDRVRIKVLDMHGGDDFMNFVIKRNSAATSCFPSPPSVPNNDECILVWPDEIQLGDQLRLQISPTTGFWYVVDYQIEAWYFTQTPTPSPTNTPIPPTNTPLPTNTATATATPITPTSTVTPGPTPTPTPTPTITNTPLPSTATPTPGPTPYPTTNNWFEWYGINFQIGLDWLAAIFGYLWDWLAWYGAVFMLFVDLANNAFLWLYETFNALWLWLIGQVMHWSIIVLNVIIVAWNRLIIGIGNVLSGMMDLLVNLWNSLTIVAGYVWGWLLSISELFLAALSLGGGLFNILLSFFKAIGSFFANLSEIPLKFYYEVNNGVNGEAFRFLPTCQTQADDWCMTVVAFLLFDRSIANSILYPVVIVGITVLTIQIVVSNVLALISFRIK